MRPAWRALAAALTAIVFAPASAQEKLPLHERIDQLVEAAAVGPLAATCSDADFVRRVYLDLTGIIPAAEEARTFLNDSSSAKRQRLIDELLAGPAFLRHMTITFDVMLMERKADKNIKQPEWEAFLYGSLAADKPLDQLVRELIAADGAEGPLRPAARFVLDREAEPNLVTRDVGRLVFGMDLQCCQCHDHPLIDDYYQNDYYGLFAFVQRTSLFTDTKTKVVQLGENAEGEASFKSVFTGAGKDRAEPRLPKGASLYTEPAFVKGEEYQVKPDKTVRGVPKFSRRAALAGMVGESVEFRRNMANRIWAIVFGRGIVHPVDFHHAANPPANPQLLALLADELQAGNFKLRPLLRELLLSRTYQRSFETPRPETINLADVTARMERLTRDKAAAQQLLQPLKDAVAKARADFKAARDENARIDAALPELQKNLAAARQSLDKAIVDHKEAEVAAAKARDQVQAVAAAAEKAGEAIAVLPDDKALAEAAVKISARANELAAAAESALATVADKSKQLEIERRKLGEAESAIATIVSGRFSVEKLKALEKEELAASQRAKSAGFEVAAIESQIATAKAILDHAALAKTDGAKAQAAWAALVERWTIAGQIAALKPLTPEQFAGSLMQATERLWAPLLVVTDKLDKSPPDVLKNAAGADRPAIRSQLTQLELLGLLRSTFGEFVKNYGGLPGQDFQATVNQALFFGNGESMDNWLKPQKGGLVARLYDTGTKARLSEADEAAAIAEELYLAVLSRPATDAEKQDVARYLRGRSSDVPIAIGEMAWALLSSTEFRFNH